jgi:hypothetical protein
VRSTVRSINAREPPSASVGSALKLGFDAGLVRLCFGIVAP